MTNDLKHFRPVHTRLFCTLSVQQFEIQRSMEQQVQAGRPVEKTSSYEEPFTLEVSDSTNAVDKYSPTLTRN
jgi:hypothetical protein